MYLEICDGRSDEQPNLMFHLAPSEVYLAGSLPRPLVRSYRTVSALPVSWASPRPSAVCFLLHLLAGHPDQPLTGTVLCGAPTFLSITPRLPGSLTKTSYC